MQSDLEYEIGYLYKVLFPREVSPSNLEDAVKQCRTEVEKLIILRDHRS